MIPQQVDILCDEFEAGLRRGGAPRIEELLGKMTQDHRAQLLYELLAVEIEFQLKRGQIVYLDELRLRFPDDAETLTLIFCSFLWQGAGFSTMTTGGDLMLRHFRLKALVGHGGFGTVWLADDTRLDREVAIKTPHAYGQQRSDGLRAALPEAAAAAKLRHPHILPVYEVSEIDGRFFMVTDYASGGTLKQLLKSRAFTCTEVARLAAQLADALHHAHSHGVIHRDLKPSNVLINEAGSLLLADFGLAVNLGGAPVAEGLVCGTHAYMAPEQADGRFGGERADIYSLGVILEDMLEVASTSVSGEMPGRSGLGGSNRLVARALRKIGDKCCHLDPPQRYASAEALCTDLRRVSEGKPPRNVQSGLRERTSWFVRRHWKALSGTLAGALLVAAAALSATPPPHPDARLVQIATDPPGCELAVVPLDPMTGDPIPERLERLRTRSPAKHYLVPGDYLVVAVQDMATFHEVVRHVPPKSEMIPFVHPHQRWRLVDNVIQLPVIRVQSPKWPRPTLTVEAGQVLVAGENARPEFAERLLVPGFQVVTSPIDRASVLASHGHTEESPETQKTPWNLDTAIAMSEHAGLRLPTAAEFALMQSRAGQLSTQGLSGLNDSQPEWTSSRVGSIGSGLVPAIDPQSAPRYSIVLGIGGSEVRNTRDEVVIRQGSEQRLSLGPQKDVAARPVRSVRPRLTADDFVRSAPAIVREAFAGH